MIYIILTIVWYDPYNVTSMHDVLTKDGWKAWSRQLWKAPAIWLVIYIFLGFSTAFHNFILIKYNKYYDLNNDYEATIRRKDKLTKIRRKIILKEINK